MALAWHGQTGGNIGYTRDRTKTNKTKQKDEQHESTKNPGVNPGAGEY